jgi:teichuronic acid biosynthesis glycosyltransferase TuaG
MPQLSVVIPCYNAAPFIAMTLSSVLGQSFRDFEVLVMDDRSTDASREVVREMATRDSRVRLIELDRNYGAPAAPRNAGVRAARGRWVAFLDADDLWHPAKLELQLRALEETGAAMCSTAMCDFRNERGLRWRDPGPRPRIERITWRKQLLKYRTPTSSIVVDRELMLACPFNEDLSYKAREDTDCFIRVHEHMPCSIKLRHPLVYYRLQANQISGNKWRMVSRHLSMLQRYRQKSGAPLGGLAYVYTATHFVSSIWLRLVRGVL